MTIRYNITDIIIDRKMPTLNHIKIGLKPSVLDSLIILETLIINKITGKKIVYKQAAQLRKMG